MLEKIKKIVPESPGVYLWKNKEQETIYIGKSKNLKNRMSQYFKGTKNSRYTYKMVEEIVSFEFFVTKNEKEALLLELDLITNQNPKYNILLKNNKRYPYLVIKKGKKLTIKIENEYKKEKSSFYFGPFPPNYGLSYISDYLKQHFLYENGLEIDEKKWNPTLVEEKYAKIKEILTKNQKSFALYLEKKYKEYILDDNKLELALQIRKFKENLEKNTDQEQNIQLQIEEDVDFFDIREFKNSYSISVFSFRYGNLLSIQKENYKKSLELNFFLLEYLEKYYQTHFLPNKIVLNNQFENNNFSLLEENIFKKIVFPKKGTFKKVSEWIEENSKKEIENTKFLEEENKKEEILLDLQEKLGLKKLNNFIIIDNSFERHRFPVSVILFYKNGENIEKHNFLKFHNNLNYSSDDKFINLGIKEFFNKNSKLKIDLIFVDGGQIQINSALKALEINNIPVFGLKKDDKHKTKEIVDINNKKYVVKENTFLFLSNIQEKVDEIAKKFHNKLSNSYLKSR
ncbi:GIY-YIG nuclease family protein [Mesomycoplasma molare]|uniref:GIY-YIG nuclease family protein n=1 Tax=Mesomycoplasma molare TaxID=171288 RepID=A0ABY5TY33_9BACT|nr:GIY-YIG nuclease family protein [Mesomycoplasma molare]UWD34148.1 GIY-YIG nuclease family protein [Mesomycoplasma molare]